MKRTFIFSTLILIGILGSLQSLKADSPLTSTPFYKAYTDLKMVAYAKESGIVDKKIARYLSKSNVPLHEKAAVINALGWDFDGKKNAELYLDYLSEKRGLDLSTDIFVLPAADLFCVGYLTALDNYFEVRYAQAILQSAEKQMPNNFTVAFIHGLVQAQIAMDSDWCKVYQVVHVVESNPNLERAMRPTAVKIIMDYIQLYQEECG